MDQRRIILFLVFAFSLMMLWESWLASKQPPTPPASAQTSGQPADVATPAAGADLPTPSATTLGAAPPPVASADAAAAAPATMVVETPLMRAIISARGGDIVRMELLQHGATDDPERPFVLFDNGERHRYSAQSGLIGDGLPNHRTPYQLPAESLSATAGDDPLEVRLRASEGQGVQVDKVLVFDPASYEIEVRFEITNLSSDASVQPLTYHQFVRDGEPADAFNAFGVNTYTGPAFYTAEQHFKKVAFGDIADGDAQYVRNASDGWAAMVQHYFVAAWLPVEGAAREYFARALDGGLYAIGVILPGEGIGPGQTGSLGLRLYAGPQEQEHLLAVAPGLDLVVDYGMLTVIASPLFWVLNWFHDLTGNWGWAIILVTISIKAMFYPLSAASYKSMAKMRVLGPRLQRLKEVCGDDKQKLQQEMMNLYRNEKINPLGGCLPILVQIPVFIALYWVLLGSVEMRQAPWLGWITDLSAKDPYFILPIIMGASMLVQFKLNPTPPDPMQAKLMMAMPIVFTVMFLWFPSGLVLYWVVNNLLSILQQWRINQVIEAGNRKGGAKPA